MDTRPYQKIIIEKDDELVDIIRKIHSAKNDRVVLTFTESSDILISPINLRVLQQEADEVVKSLVAQIIQNPAGISNAQEAGLVVTDLPTEIVEELWEEAEINMRARVRKNDDKLKKSHLIDNIRQEEPSKDETPLNEDGENPIDREEKKSEESRLSKDDEDTAEEDLNEEDTTSTNVEPDETFDPESAKEKSELPTRELSDFEKRIAQAMEKSKDGLNTEKSKIVKTGDFVMAIDEDINKVRSRDDAQRQDDGDNNNDTIGSQDLRLLGKDYLSKGNVGSESSGFKGNNPKTQISKMPTVKQSEEYNYVDEGFSSEREEKTFESGQKGTVIAGMTENQNQGQR